MVRFAAAGFAADRRQGRRRRSRSRSTAWTTDFNAKARKTWTDNGGELISLPPDDQSAMLKILASVGDDVAKAKPPLSAAYQIVTEAAQRMQ